MTTPKCPPLELDDALLALLEKYRVAKGRASVATRGGATVESQGHYDKDTPLAPRNAQEVDAMTAERSAAIKVADELLTWVDKHR